MTTTPSSDEHRFLSIEGSIVSGQGGMPKVTVVAADGACAEIYRYGAHVTSWIPAGGDERLFLSRKAEFAPGIAIRGGVPVIFPQFANEGPLRKHGFARTTDWDLVSTSRGDASNATFRLSSSPATEAVWPHEFVAELVVTVGGSSLDLALSVVNTGSTAAAFTAALHTYLRVTDVRQTIVRGLAGLTYADSTSGGVRRQETAEHVMIAGEVDRTYLDVVSPVTVDAAAHTTTIDKQGFTDVVVWNPGRTLTQKLSDMESDGYLRMLCVEAAAVGKSVALEPGGRWSGGQRLTAER